MSHHSVNRFLQHKNIAPKDLFMKAETKLILEGGTVSVDDIVLDNPYTATELSSVIISRASTTKPSRTLISLRSITLISRVITCLSIFVFTIRQKGV
ncbi:hypothetical protein CI610_01716 [invertebrate metagenome]|uniref:Uncharacterized protein n=1 Tax=invertebrate metagenome TaxID=1711999 RepID=A0A2H9T7W1_9ZZZZ